MDGRGTAPRTNGAGSLGPLERAVLERLWDDGPQDVRTMHAREGVPRALAPNTIQSTLERLHRKGLATREKRGRAFVYAAALSRQDWLSRVLEGLRSALPPAARDSLVLAFVDLLERADPQEMAALEARIRQRRGQP